MENELRKKKIGERWNLTDDERHLAELYQEDLGVAMVGYNLAVTAIKWYRTQFWDALLELNPEWRQYELTLNRVTMEVTITGYRD